jgi:branched-chain amino acid transport system permease protein
MSRRSLCGSLRFGLLATLLRGFFVMLFFDRRQRWIFWMLLAALLLLPFITDALLGRGWVRIVDFAMLYIMLALGLNIVVGYAGLLDLGYIAFFAVGAYCYALTGSPHLAQAFPGLFPQGLHLSFWLVMPLAALLAGGFGALLGAPTLRLRGDYLAKSPASS